MLDGNAIAGTLSTVFGADMTLVVATCGGWGGRGPGAETGVYVGAPGVVVGRREVRGVRAARAGRRDGGLRARARVGGAVPQLRLGARGRGRTRRQVLRRRPRRRRARRRAA